jgi:hypothetical protein
MGPELIVMNTLFKNPSTPGAAALAENLAPGADKTPLIDRLADGAAEIPESQLMAILDEFPHDETVHTAIIARPYLSESVIVRLVALVSPALLDSLISRHPLPEKYRREVMKRRSGRPEWWTRGLLNFGR